MNSKIHFFAAAIGNLFEHYDKYLFAFLAPFIAPLFFHTESTLVSLILTFCMMPLGLLSRPLGALVFGKIGDRQGRKKALMITLVGMALVTFGMGFLPTYEKVGFWAPVFLAFARLLQNFFAAGEVTGGALLILEHCNPKRRSLYSSIYDCSCIIGILIASLAVSFLAEKELIGVGWRYLYFAGGLTAFIGMGLRTLVQEHEPFYQEAPPIKVIRLIIQEWTTFLALCMGVGFSYAIYETVTTLLNSYLPYVSDLSQTDSVWNGSLILVLDLFLLPIFGYLAMRYSYQKTMTFFLFLTIMNAFPLFYFLKDASLLTVSIVRTTFVILGVGFSAPLYAWAVESVSPLHRYTLISLSTAIGSQLAGGGTCAGGLWLYKVTGWVGAPGIFLAFLGLLTLLTLNRFSFRTSPALKTQVETA